VGNLGNERNRNSGSSRGSERVRNRSSEGPMKEPGGSSETSSSSGWSSSDSPDDSDAGSGRSRI
jgi:hypothetical protein